MQQSLTIPSASAVAQTSLKTRACMFTPHRCQASMVLLLPGHLLRYLLIHKVIFLDLWSGRRWIVPVSLPVWPKA